ncbi:hypothetical protein [Saccharopolyspora taberi]|uniref:Uncharacterized protein n=1 Tax=Saccharopolyspora taberi TaxID=60895 RepID=A0ABN3V0E6_9PSEU
MSDYRETKDYLANTPLPAEIREVVSEALDSFAYSQRSKDQIAAAILRLPDRASIEFTIRDVYEADLIVDEMLSEAAASVMRLFLQEGQEVRS